MMQISCIITKNNIKIKRDKKEKLKTSIFIYNLIWFYYVLNQDKSQWQFLYLQ